MEAVTCDLQYSGVADAFLALTGGATLALVVVVPFPAEARALIAAWALGGAARARARLTGTCRLRISCEGDIQVHARGRVVEGRVVAGCFIAPWLTIVRWRASGTRLASSLVLLPGMVGEAQLRNIRVILRWA